MTEQDLILVTGATGTVGRQVVSQLLDAGARVRALARHPESADLPSEVEVVRGDLSAPDTLEPALDGVTSVFLVWPFLTADLVPAVLSVVGRHARRIVYLSSLGVRDDTDQQSDPINQFHADVERAIERSGMAWTFLRPSSFASNILGWADQIRAGGVVRDPFGGARPLIHERDIAAAAVRVLTSDGHAGAKLPLTGPWALTGAEQVQAIAEAIGRPLRYEQIPPEVAREQMLAAGYPAPLVDALVVGAQTAAPAPQQITSVVEELTGKPARTLQEWALDHADDFRAPPQS
ncbi:NAD(P)H-binding protein [Actinopolymorpha alba]|uniref:NAD(P)H-binding protein n=1 Tax=Actinopolymorpha alba TaxID=533267 RepID=UPI000363AC26|nr:NAD(P)H-binding protein [Actinopolymorpha alba]